MRAKKILSMLLVLVMMLSLFPMNAFALGGGREIGIGGGFGRDIGDDEIREFDPTDYEAEGEDPVDYFQTTDYESGITVTVQGEVIRPGTFVLGKGATMYDLIMAASGTTSNADVLSFNTDYVAPAKGSYYIAPLYDNSSTCSAAPITKVNINKAEAEELQAVAGFTKTVATAIVSYRVSKNFEAIEEIKNVSGIGAATYLSCRDKITLRDAS